MLYQIKSRATSEVLFEAHYEEEVDDFILDCEEEVYVDEIIPCRGCKTEEGFQRHDWYGIPTGHYCDECYENNYPYRKTRYATIEHDGYGERLSEDY